MKKATLQFILASLVACAACEPTLVAEFQDRPVVECYLYQNEPVKLTVQKLIPYRTDVRFSNEDVNALAITVRDETTGAACLLAAQGNGLYAGDSAFLPQPEHAYSLQFTYDGTEVTASTALAALPQNVTWSGSSLSVPSFGGGGFGGGREGSSITVRWSNAEEDYYLLAVRPLSPDSANLIDSGVVRTLSDALVQDSVATLSTMQLSYFGAHELRLCRLQPEMAALLRRSEQSRTSQTLTEVNANISGGFGIFTGVSCAKKIITVVR